MRFEDERYIRVYTRDTTTMVMLSWEARAVMLETFRKVDRAGLLDLGEDGLEALAVTIRIPVDVVERVMPELLRRKVFELRPDGLLIAPRFVEAQEALLSDKARARASRERARDIARAEAAGVTPCDEPSRLVTEHHAANEIVTDGHAPSHAVTGGHSEPRCTEPRCAERESERDASPPAPPVVVTRGIPGNAVNHDGIALPPEPAKKTQRGKRITADWQPSPATVEWCHEQGVDPEPVVSEFVDHWSGVSGRAGVKLTWDGTFKNRIRQLIDWNKAPKWEPPKLGEDGQPLRLFGGLPIRTPSAKPMPRDGQSVDEFLREQREAANG